MDLSLTPAEEAFQRELTDWLARELPEEWTAPRLRALPADEAFALRRAWGRKLGQAGWLGLAWPVEYGGRGATLMEQVLFHQTLHAHRAPELVDERGLGFVGPTIIEAGTDEQKARVLGPILRHEVIWAQGFSEPNAGSDLASLQTRAERDGDDWVITGQKIWSSGAEDADWYAVLARTDPQAPKHRGITFFLVDMTSPGITVRRLKQMNEDTHFDTHFCEVFLDGVRVPAENVLGEVNGGWRVATRLLTYERGVPTMTVLTRFETLWQQMRDYMRTTRRNGRLLADDERLRERLAHSYTDIQLMRLANLRLITGYQRGAPSGTETSYMKLFWAATEQRLCDLAMELGGPDSLEMRGSPGAVGGGDWVALYLLSRAVTIYGGTQDIQRNIIAERIFGLPR